MCHPIEGLPRLHSQGTQSSIDQHSAQISLLLLVRHSMMGTGRCEEVRQVDTAEPRPERLRWRTLTQERRPILTVGESSLRMRDHSLSPPHSGSVLATIAYGEHTPSSSRLKVRINFGVIHGAAWCRTSRPLLQQPNRQYRGRAGLLAGRRPCPGQAVRTGARPSRMRMAGLVCRGLRLSGWADAADDPRQPSYPHLPPARRTAKSHLRGIRTINTASEIFEYACVWLLAHYLNISIWLAHILKCDPP
ncbi:hypothetical protein FHR71_002263 [Methylobacterium sp. RAS18]|nr:hypothetical protein [Methylobacterium sp. RAS18]